MMNDCESIKSELRFTNYEVNRIDYRSNPQYDKNPVEVTFKLEYEVIQESPKASVRLDIEVFPESEMDNYPFRLSVSITGHFEMSNPDNPDIDKLLHMNSVSILFPYARSLVTTITSNCNVSPLILPPINVLRVIENSMMSQSADCLPE